MHRCHVSICVISGSHFAQFTPSTISHFPTPHKLFLFLHNPKIHIKSNRITLTHKEPLLHCRNFSSRNYITARKLLSAQSVSYCPFIVSITFSGSLEQCVIPPFSQLAFLLRLILPFSDTFSTLEHDSPEISTSPFSA